MSFVLNNKGKGMQSSSDQPLVWEEHCVTTLITAVKETRWNVFEKKGYIFRGVPFFSLLPVYGSIRRKILTGFPSQMEAPKVICSFQISLRPRFYGEKLSPEKKGHPPTRATLGEPKFPPFSYRT